MVKLYFGEALGLIGKTMPFIWVRLGSYALLGLGLGLYFGVMGGIAWLLASLWAPLGIIVFLLALAARSGWCAGRRATTFTCSKRRTRRS